MAGTVPPSTLGYAAELDPCSSDATAAMAAMIGTTELLEAILQYLPIYSLLDAKLVSWRWKDVVGTLCNTNTLVRKRLFLEPATLEEIVQLDKLERQTDSSRPRYQYVHQSSATIQDYRYPPAVVAVNPYLLRLAEDHHSEMWLTTPVRSGDMFLTQPPSAEHTWGLVCGEPIPDAQPAVRQAEEGERIWFRPRGWDEAPRDAGRVRYLMDQLEERGMEQSFGTRVDWSCARIDVGRPVSYVDALDWLDDGEVVLDEHVWAILLGES
ncbi:hypothetical protein LTR56_016297 [Elasticomyces elasticus]|nr:hypothetical protein LTR56_016297 [Elasticomyces elasticus]KAK3642859.1 hypothetical protein LTR22_015917 [Elasticomyces elasticus]KAK4920733.1 hypothetical protein LTR49_011809 [Elasticomyces elasticus]KAK5754147.1 hypothetical protein LTS12_015789 [Elasticomyces elasticus]